MFLINLENSIFDDNRMLILQWINEEMNIRKSTTSMDFYIKQILKNEIQVNLIIEEVSTHILKPYYTFFNKNIKQYFRIHAVMFGYEYFKMNNVDLTHFWKKYYHI